MEIAPLFETRFFPLFDECRKTDFMSKEEEEGRNVQYVRKWVGGREVDFYGLFRSMTWNWSSNWSHFHYCQNRVCGTMSEWEMNPNLLTRIRYLLLLKETPKGRRGGGGRVAKWAAISNSLGTHGWTTNASTITTPTPPVCSNAPDHDEEGEPRSVLLQRPKVF